MTCLLTACGDRGGLFEHARNGRAVHAILPAAPDLREGATVRYRGIEVGRVTAVRIVDTGVQLDLAIQRADAPLRTADQVRAVPTGIFGDRQVEIVPGPVSAPKLAPDGWLVASPPDTLAAIRDAVIGAVVQSAFDRLATRDSASGTRQRANSVHPPASRSHP